MPFKDHFRKQSNSDYSRLNIWKKLKFLDKISTNIFANTSISSGRKMGEDLEV